MKNQHEKFKKRHFKSRRIPIFNQKRYENYKLYCLSRNSKLLSVTDNKSISQSIFVENIHSLAKVQKKKSKKYLCRQIGNLGKGVNLFVKKKSSQLGSSDS